MEDDDNSSSSIGFLKRTDIPVVSRWLFSEWYDCYIEWGVKSVEGAINDLENFWVQMNDTNPPIQFMLVAAVNSQPVGCVAVDDKDMLFPPSFTLKECQWLTDVYVLDSFRGKGLGKKLVVAAQKKAKEMGIKKLQLVTENHHEFYKKLGWNRKREFIYSGKQYKYMIKDL